MASFAGYVPKPTALSPVQQVDMIWAMGVASLVSNNNHIIIPVTITNTLGAWGINELVSRLRSVTNPAKLHVLFLTCSAISLTVLRPSHTMMRPV